MSNAESVSRDVAVVFLDLVAAAVIVVDVVDVDGTAAVVLAFIVIGFSIVLYLLVVVTSC